ncbi:hypothetical protein JYT74_02920 [Crocinitomix catalasitica]|nr:hypothetical protein [Crocinitomix catalasitica]
MNKLIYALTMMTATMSNAVQAEPEMRLDDRVRIKQAIEISNQFGEQVWEGITKVPFTIILVTDTVEFLINHPYPSKDFTLIGYDSLLQSDVLYRKTQFDKHFLATFPAVNGVNCIVMGTPENTDKTSTEWIITLLHEHFHQYQYTYPDYYQSVEKLGLSGGDNTGMWMLNYPFAYTDENIIQQYDKYVKALSEVVESLNQEIFEAKFKQYIIERENFTQLLDTNDYKYFSFQIWQEGLARYTEYKFLQLLDDYESTQAVTELADFISFSQYKDELYQSELQSLTELSLKENQRICFYSIGFAEGLILDELNFVWRDNYLTNKFFIEHYSDRMTN